MVNVKIRDSFFGLAVGDALGVPFEFKSRQSLTRNPCRAMIGFGTHNQPPGTWSDDTSLSFCLTEALIQGFDPACIARNFVKWVDDGFWTPRGKAFDIGITTRRAISRLKDGVTPEAAGDNDEQSNGNGSLMRILPLLFYIADKPIDQRFNLARQASSLTHRHPRSTLACFMYLEFARNILHGQDKFSAYQEIKRTVPEFISTDRGIANESRHFSRILTANLDELDVGQISSSGYVVHTLEASLWCLLRNNSYPEVVLSAVNLGEDTDTTAAVAGGLAGLLYGSDSIPAAWIRDLARLNDIEELVSRFSDSIA